MHAETHVGLYVKCLFLLLLSALDQNWSSLTHFSRIISIKFPVNTFQQFSSCYTVDRQDSEANRCKSATFCCEHAQIIQVSLNV
jgi:hypothetical protein